MISGYQKACAKRDDNHPLIAIATVTGSEQDPQCRSKQIEALKSANIVVMNNLPEAILLAKKLITTNQFS